MKPNSTIKQNEEFLSFELRNKELVLSFHSEDPLSTAWKVLRKLLSQREAGQEGEALSFTDTLTLKLDEVIGLPGLPGACVSHDAHTEPNSAEQ